MTAADPGRFYGKGKRRRADIDVEDRVDGGEYSAKRRAMRVEASQQSAGGSW